MYYQAKYDNSNNEYEVSVVCIVNLGNWLTKRWIGLSLRSYCICLSQLANCCHVLLSVIIKLAIAIGLTNTYS